MNVPDRENTDRESESKFVRRDGERQRQRKKKRESEEEKKRDVDCIYTKCVRRTCL